MKFSEEDKIEAVRRNKNGESATGIIRELKISPPTFYLWKKRYSLFTTPDKTDTRKIASAIVDEVNSDNQRIRELLAENTRLKTIVADLSLLIQ
jgi:transposase-like protein